ncbi:hypothetical protein ADICYQ_3443 [Cyclobacterium qasimii M12-11B]|uniref:Uncharacterized protein n=1 Tax=Cyclobacterium qasimii M12-11B TaxID=641524 RepID=S7WL16_9BACT|nr:hypothetical protein ADICYQ_3443 [Cyclobacterium qasimii M12-11B]
MMNFYGHNSNVNQARNMHYYPIKGNNYLYASSATLSIPETGWHFWMDR